MSQNQERDISEEEIASKNKTRHRILCLVNDVEAEVIKLRIELRACRMILRPRPAYPPKELNQDNHDETY